MSERGRDTRSAVKGNGRVTRRSFLGTVVAAGAIAGERTGAAGRLPRQTSSSVSGAANTPAALGGTPVRRTAWR